MDTLLDGINAGDLDYEDDCKDEQDDGGWDMFDGTEGLAPLTPPLDGIFSLGFMTGRKIAIPLPSAAAVEKAKRMLDDDEPTELSMPLAKKHRDSVVGVHQSAMPMIRGPELDLGRSSETTTTGGKSIPLSSPALRVHVTSRTRDSPEMSRSLKTGEVSGSALSQEGRHRTSAVLNDTPAKPASAFTTGAGYAVAGPSRGTQAQVAALFGNDTPSKPFPAINPSAIRLESSKGYSGTPSRGASFRVPLSTHTPSRNVQSQSISTPPQRRRVGLGMSTPRAKTGFTTPFRKPDTPAPLRTSVLPPKPVALPKSVFDLDDRRPGISYRQARLKPGYYSIADLEERSIPSEIWQINLSTAAYYHFEDSGTLGHDEACQRLSEDCPLITPKWTRNHWQMILWKLAGIIQAQPELYDSLWCSDEILRQLRYRYEREINRAQRSVVRRIHEHDSAPGLPLILCIAAIKYPEAADAGPVPYLELTDGWYRIKAQLDLCLAQAVKAKKITIGQKLAITGAKLESGSDGAEALDAIDKSCLVINGNSCQLTSWDAKLGLQRKPFVSGLSSLTVDGGVITLMDITLDKVFPLAFTNAGKGPREDPWGEDEERIRHDKWKEKYEFESTRLQDAMRVQMDKLEDILQSLEPGTDGSADIDADSVWDRLVSSASPSAMLRTLPGAAHASLMEHGQRCLETAKNNAMSEIQAELETLCPAREVRNFRVVRFTDARTGYKEPYRAGMLNVWDASALGKDALTEGQRYLVSNLMPGKAGDWRSKSRPDGAKVEIYVHTRRDTRWQKL